MAREKKDQAPEGAESGNAGENAGIPPIHGKVAVVSESRKGKTIIAVSGEPIVFDNKGKATVNEEDALYLKQCPDFKVG
jgi:hypothetical protein